MPRIARMLNHGEKTAYHIISRTALDGFPFGDVEKEEFVKIIKQFASVYFVDVIGFSVLENHGLSCSVREPGQLFINGLRSFFGVKSVLSPILN